MNKKYIVRLTAKEGSERGQNDFLNRSGPFFIVPSGWQLMAATDINDAGEIVGEGYNPAGQRASFLLIPTGEAFPETGDGGGSGTVPEPTTLIVWSLLGTVAIGLGLRRKQKAM